MRITNPTITRNYTRNLNNNLSMLNRYSTMTYTGRKFATMAENPGGGVRAMQIRRSLDSVDSYTATAKTVLSTYKSAEDSMMKVVDLAKDIYVRYENALNGTNGPDEYETFVAEIGALQKEMLACANAKFSDRFMFGGTNTTTQPFTTSEDGKTLFYNGVDVSQIADNDGNVKPEFQYLFDDAAYVDIGLGLKHNADGSLVTSSAFKNTLNGLDFLGYGDDNIYLVVGEILDAIQSPDFKNAPPYDQLLNKIQDCYKDVTIQVTDLGANYQYLEYTVDRMAGESINLLERQNEIEFMDSAEAILQFKMQEYVYNASLQMGQRLLQPTLFNFIS